MAVSLSQPDILSQYAEEAAFLWLLRDQAVSAPHYSLADLAKLDHRIEAHLDGLRVAGDAGWEIVQQELKWEEPGEVFAAAVLAFESDDMARIQPVLTVARPSPELARGLISALGWLPFEKVALRINQLAASQTTDLRRIGIAAAAIHRQDPGRALADSLTSDDPALRARALRAAGELGRTDLLPVLRQQTADENETCRFAAGWSAALLGDKRVIAMLQSIAAGGSAHAPAAMEMALRCLDLPAALAWQRQMASDPKRTRTAVIAAGVIGDPVSIPWLIEQMTVADWARVAGESFTFITGADLALSHLEIEAPPGSAGGSTDSPEDEDVAMDPDENLPWPDPALVRAWWDKHKQEFAAGTRHLLGQPMTVESLMEILRSGRQRQRAAAALELVLRDPKGKTPLFEIRAPGLRQQRMLR
jgi:uncharacterized protein (TIGR02270 family)